VLRFDSGTVGLLEVNWLTPTKVRRLMVTGERGMLTVDYLNQHLTLHENAHLAGDWETLDIFTGVAEGNMTRFAIARAEPLREQLESFVSSIQEGQSPVASGNQGLRVLRLALACVSAGVRGETVALKPETGLAARVRGLR
jgi:predicted dehydrogenase